jgi:hypothetical protein
LFVSNPSRQNVKFKYRTTQAKRFADTLVVPALGQVEIGHNWSSADRAMFIEQIRLHGGRSAAETRGSSLTRFYGLIYRENVPVAVDEIDTAAAAVIATKETLTKEAVLNTAAGFDRNANGHKPQGKRKAVVTETTIQQVVPQGHYPTGNEIDFKLTIDPTVNSATPIPA